MPDKPTHPGALPIGVDFGSSSVKLAQVRPLEPAGYDLVSTAVADVPIPCRSNPTLRRRFLSETLRDLVASEGFEGTDCILSLPAGETFVQPIRLPKSASADMDAAIRAEIADRVPFSVDSAIVRHIPAEEVYEGGEAKQEAIVVAASEATVHEYLSIVRKAKLEPVGVDVEPLAIVECFARLFEAEGGGQTVLFVDIGEDTTQVVLARGTRVFFIRNLPTGGRQLVEAVANAKNISPGQAWEMRLQALRSGESPAGDTETEQLLAEPISTLSGELTQCLRYCESVFKNESVERAVFLGGQAYDRTLCQSIARRMNLPAQIGDPLLQIRREGQAQTPPEPRLAVAVGLSLGAQVAA
jgi:type IV pilus assembly protein PilM